MSIVAVNRPRQTTHKQPQLQSLEKNSEKVIRKEKEIVYKSVYVIELKPEKRVIKIKKIKIVKLKILFKKEPPTIDKWPWQ